MSARIIDRGRGPEIEGTRITVYDVVDYWRKDWRAEHIAGLFRLPIDAVESAIRYIETHREEVMADYEQILARHRDFEYSPEVEEKRRQSRERLENRLKAIATGAAEARNASDHGGS